MAGTLFTLLVLVVSFLAGSIPVTVAQSQSGSSYVCLAMDNCFDQFRGKVSHIAHDREQFCKLMQLRLNCYHSVLQTCDDSTKSYAQSTIRNTNKEYQQACDASGFMSSFTVLSFGLMASIISYRLL